MTNKLIQESEINIDLYPSFSPIGEGNQLAIGDLHGNALKLLHILIKHEIVESNPDDYQDFVEIYRKNKLQREDLNKIKQICENLKIKNKTKICLIGDILADRGQNDYFTLLLLNKLHKESVPLDILLSNHDYTFIESLEINEIFRSTRPCGDAVFGRSMYQLQDLIDENILDKNEIIRLARESFLPHLKLLSCVINHYDEITYFSHAGIDEEVIANFSKEMNVSFRADNAILLADTIAAINLSFQQNYVAKGLIHTLPKEEYLVIKEDPITFTMWNRDYSLLQEPKRPYKVNRVHGHDSNGPELEGVYCLDSPLGANLELHSGEYRVLVSYLNQQPTNQITQKTSLNSNEERRKEINYVNDHFRMPTQDIQKITFKPFFGKRLGRVELDKENINQNVNTRF